MELICSVDTNFESAQAKSSNRNSIIICFYIEFTFVLFFIVIRPNQHVFFSSFESFDLYLFFALTETLTPSLSLCFGNLLCNQRFDHLKNIQALEKKEKEMTRVYSKIPKDNIVEINAFKKTDGPILFKALFIALSKRPPVITPELLAIMRRCGKN